MRLLIWSFVHPHPIKSVCDWVFFLSEFWMRTMDPFFENNHVCSLKQYKTLPCSRQENKMPNKTSNKNSTWVEGGRWAGWGQTRKRGTFFKGIITQRSEHFSHTVANAEMMEWFVALVLNPVVNWPVEVFYQHDSKDLCSLQTNHVELELWPRESFGYHADKIL